MLPEAVPEQLWPAISDFIARTTGLHFPPERRTDLERGFRSAAADLGFDSPIACADWLLSAPVTPAQLHTLAAHLTIGETYFFRERKVFEALELRVLPQLIARCRPQRRLRLWCAACATGEEPYSLAILLQQLLADWREWHITLLATDINKGFLEKAVEGVYGEWSFRDLPAGFKERYFTRRADGRYSILPEVRDAVQFSALNLAQVSASSATDMQAMDLILCRNVLIYFTTQQTAQLVTRLYRSLSPGGWLAVSPTECSQTVFSQFVAESFPGAILYRKDDDRERADHARVELPSSSAQGRGDIACNAPTSEDTNICVHSAAIADPDPLPALELSARTLADGGRLAEALKETERWIDSDKLHAEAHYLHAMVAQELGDFTLARQSLQRAAYLEPDFILVHFALGNLARRFGRSEEARRHFRNAANCLSALTPHEVLRASDGMTAGRLAEIIEALLQNAGAPS